MKLLLPADGNTVGSPSPGVGGYGFTSWPRAELPEEPLWPLEKFICRRKSVGD